jgi:L-seryl-tRNA(Ser) seleniumtransferase
MNQDAFRELPAVHQVLAEDILRGSAKDYSHDQIVAAIRAELEDIRHRLAQGEVLDGQADAGTIARRALVRLGRSRQFKLRPVINATGIILHTNLGRAPVASEAAKAAHEAACGYLNLELDLETGKRSSRQAAIREWVCLLTGAEAATAVNNNAAATVIALHVLCQGREAIISRGQLIEIGGAFRIPEIMAISGAILREVGTTNITRLADYEQAVGSATGALMRVHTSNYRISGFTKEVSLKELVGLGRRHQLAVIDDIGSGALIDFARFGFGGEPLARTSIADGADLVLFSADKLLGGPQAGILAGRKELIQRIEKTPLMRAFRLDKMTLAALEATLRLYLNEERALEEVPVLRMLATPLEELRQRAKGLSAQLRHIPGIASPGIASVGEAEDETFVGGGSLPDQSLKTWVIELSAQGQSEQELSRRLRLGSPAVVSRVRDGKIVFDLRTVFPQQEAGLVRAISEAVGARPKQ